MSSIHQNPIPTPPPRRRGHARPVPVYTAPSDLSHRLWHCAIGAMIAFGIGCEISIRGLGIKPAAPAITIPAAILGALIVWFFPRRRRWQTLAITPTELQLQSFDHQAITIPPTGVSLLLGENGISTAGGDMLIWKRLHIATPGRRYTFRFDPHFNASAYHALLHACPHAIGVSTSGAVAVPRAALHSDEAIAACTRVVRTEFTRRARRTFLAALVAIAIVAGGVALITLAAARDPNFTADSIAPTSVYLVVALAFSISLTASALATRARGRRILRTIAARAEHPAAHSDLPSHVLFDLPPPPPQRPVGLATKLFALLTLILSIVPILGLLLGLASLHLTRQTRGPARLFTWCALVMNLLVSAVTLYFIIEDAW